MDPSFQAPSYPSALLLQVQAWLNGDQQIMWKDLYVIANLQHSNFFSNKISILPHILTYESKVFEK